MGASFHELVTKTDCQDKAREEINRCQREELEEYGNGDGYPDSFYGIGSFNWTEKEFKSVDEAREYVQNNTEKWKPGLVVKVMKNSKGKMTKRRQKMLDDYADVVSKLKKFRRSKGESLRSIVESLKKEEGVKRNYKCKVCKSSINSKYINGYSNYSDNIYVFNCPVCKSELEDKLYDKEIKKHELLRSKISEKLDSTESAFFWFAGGWSPC